MVVKNICFSGGAKGADLEWGVAAKKVGHAVIHYSFVGHSTKADSLDLKILTNDELQIADEFLREANKSLKRHLPVYKPWIINLLRRNYYQINESNAVYAIAEPVKDNQVEGGTGWAVQLFLDRLNREGKSLELFPIFCYSQTLQKWSQCTDKGWKLLNTQPPLPSGFWTGIGTRDLTDFGKKAIHSIFGGSDGSSPGVSLLLFPNQGK